MKILFILKERFYNNTNVKSYGLINSATHIHDFLEFMGYESKVVTVIDDNFIDKELYYYRPDVVIIEALWVRPQKLKELMELRRYHNIKWVIRIHSDIGYLSAETYALKYINDYLDLKKNNLFIAPNNKNLCKYLSHALYHGFKYLPNIVRGKACCHKHHRRDYWIEMHVGCLGALRILKNQVFQALCAMEAATRLNKILCFHITIDPKIKDDVPNPVLRNLEELFKNSGHKLIKHVWQENDKFQHLVRDMDIGMQLSFSESFNIVSADFIYNRTPIIVSDTVTWMPDELKASTWDYDSVVEKIIEVYQKRKSWFLLRKMRMSLDKHNYIAQGIWLEFLKNL